VTLSYTAIAGRHCVVLPFVARTDNGGEYAECLANVDHIYGFGGKIF